MRYDIPFARAGQTIGLLGGSFDPPHAGHVHITHEALKRFGLDRVWWMVSPGNPLKAHGPAPLPDRLAACRDQIQHPRVDITGIEARLGTRATADTLAGLRNLYPGVRFVWLMGADNLAQLHRWQDWQTIMATTPVGVLARPGDRMAARMSVAARRFRFAYLDDPQALGRASAPAWAFANVPMLDISSSAIRKKRDAQRTGVKI